ncbi:orotidine-5'-phosphate decarboxylase [Selenihalanaerobacter shriftii]|uniref:Orotidine 5'-phosphate decarboxylase n=1 Tax=Selenihalanaerobacter shriftii TaxID=142842 RepID=A0A1T4QFB8_9FIRM|nr:orotidine-5'-phosphate decarboxylase [Selenihalanaerobacter shriftii]SKA02429.1 orotidine-5'-phosphate decarboxylase [Selenihalanaerobacter shriftii]
MSNFTDKLKAAIDEKESFVCVGLDPRLNRIPDHIKEEVVKEYGKTKEAVAEIFIKFNKGIIDAVHQHVPIVKPQIAFYEQYGHQGIRAYEETIKYAQKKGLLVIADAKRNDIGSTAQAYADGYLGEVDFWEESEFGFGADALTVNGYLGIDGIQPFIDSCEDYGKGIFILVRTSNPSAGDLQDLETDNGKVYETMAELVNDWRIESKGKNGYSAVGAVVGATYPQEAEELREVMKESYFLVPGYGAQGAGAKEVIPAFNEDGYGAVVNSARGIIFAYERKPWQEQFSAEEYQEASQAAVKAMRNDINETLDEYGKLPW